MTISEVPFGTKLFDTVVPVNPSLAAEAVKRGFGGCVRYINDLTPAEIGTIHAAGLGLLVVTYCRSEGWVPTKDMGTLDGANHAAKMAKLGLTGVTIYHDIEGVKADANPDDLMAMHDAWSGQQNGAGGVYVGAQALLTGSEWYARPTTHSYWKGLSHILDRKGNTVEPNCGWCLVQEHDDITPGKQYNLLGVPVDVSFVQRDYGLRLPNWLAP